MEDIRIPTGWTNVWGKDFPTEDIYDEDAWAIQSPDGRYVIDLGCYGSDREWVLYVICDDDWDTPLWRCPFGPLRINDVRVTVQGFLDYLERERLLS